MTTPGEKGATIKFHDHAENQQGVAVIRKFQDKVAVCFSLEENGDVEALLEKEVVEKLVEALKSAIN